MSTVEDIANYFAAIVPHEMKMDFDNVGLLVGLNKTQVTKALVALDITDEVIDEAIAENAQIILSHHPMFFQLKQINNSTPEGSRITKMISNGISGYCQHTNLDSVIGGVNDALAKKLNVEVEGWLEGPSFTSKGVEYGMGRLGHLESPMAMSEYLTFVKEALATNGIRYHDAKRPVQKVALCGGSGSEYVQRAVELGCDTLVTADINYHRFLLAKELSLNIIDADHFCTENVVVPVLANLLKSEFPEIEVKISEVHHQTIKFY